MKKIFLAIVLMAISPFALSQYAQTEGYYSASGINLKIIVLDISKGVVAAETNVFEGACSGNIAGIGQVAGRTLTFTPYVKEKAAPNCSVKVEFDQKFQRAKIDADPDCSIFSGASCGWEGQTLTKQKDKISRP